MANINKTVVVLTCVDAVLSADMMRCLPIPQHQVKGGEDVLTMRVLVCRRNFGCETLSDCSDTVNSAKRVGWANRELGGTWQHIEDSSICRNLSIMVLLQGLFVYQP